MSKEYMLVVEYPYYTIKEFFGEEIEFKLDPGALSAKLYKINNYKELLNKKTNTLNQSYDIDILQLNINL